MWLCLVQAQVRVRGFGGLACASELGGLCKAVRRWVHVFHHAWFCVLFPWHGRHVGVFESEVCVC